jgi:UDP-N-acetylmuramoyl-tripeptide--D-alanyl-D-alanine ligase
MNIVLSVFCVVLLLFLLFLLREELHIMQQNSYYNARYIKWLGGNFFFRLGAVRVFFKQKEKKKLDFTPRAIRLFACEIVLVAAVFLLLFLLSVNLLFVVLVLAICAVFSFLFILIANLSVFPLEKLINRWYVNDAKKRLRHHKELLKIAVTGSYGKTSVKHFLFDILSEKYSVLMTPGSFNTTLGVVRTVREQLQPIHEIFIAEMGAKRRGDIKEICDIVNPNFSILTSVGQQHLESFGSFDNIKSTKLEAIAALSASGTGYVNFDNLKKSDIPQQTKAKIVSFAVNSDADYTAKNIEYKNNGMVFEVFYHSEKILTLETRLLGEHNVSNLLACCGIALDLGVEKYKIENVVKRLEPVAHRLEVKKLPNGITVIDDAFNSNPVGAKMALQALKRFEGKKKIIITPGMIELGQKEYALNFEFGQIIAQNCDIAVLVGARQTKPIQEGIKSVNFPKENLFVCRNLNEANEQVKKIMQAGDVVLYENDLPDTFNEL